MDSVVDEADFVVVADDVVVNVTRRGRYAVIRRINRAVRVDAVRHEIAERVDVEQAFAEERAGYGGRSLRRGHGVRVRCREGTSDRQTGGAGVCKRPWQRRRSRQS